MNKPHLDVSEMIYTLCVSNPLFMVDGIHWPTGFSDFRDMTWPCDFRAGPYKKVSQPTQYKMLFGNREDAESCAGTLRRFGLSHEIKNPHIEPTECDGEDGKTIVPYFTLIWEECASPSPA